MKDDVEGSVESILNDTTEEDYKIVMKHYKLTLSQIENRDPGEVVNNPYLPDSESIETQVDCLLIKSDDVNFSFERPK